MDGKVQVLPQEVDIHHLPWLYDIFHFLYNFARFCATISVHSEVDRTQRVWRPRVSGEQQKRGDSINHVSE